MKVTPSNLIRWAGLSAVVGGLLFVVVQTIHPPETLSSVTTSTWGVVHYMTMAMCLLVLIGLAGIYSRQSKEAGWLGLAGYLMFSLSMTLTMAFVFVEAFISPLLVKESPKFVEGLLGMVSGATTEINLGALPTLWLLAGLLYLLGGVLFGIATFRAGILPRWAAGILALGTVLPIVLPHEIVRLGAVPVGLALAWLGYALWSERIEKESEPLHRIETPKFHQVGAD